MYAELQRQREIVHRIAKQHGVGRLWVFGSAARDEMGPTSDIDLLIDVDGPTPPWFPGGLVAELEAVLGRSVHVVEPEALREDIKQRVLSEAVPL